MKNSDATSSSIDDIDIDDIDLVLLAANQAASPIALLLFYFWCVLVDRI